MVYVEKAIRLLFGLIDGVLGWAVGVLYTLIVQIANVDVFGDFIWDFMGRIYTFLAIFMLFRLSVSVVNYVLNPDQLTDKSKGFGKLIQNVIIVIALIIMVPQIFTWAYKLQSIILNTNVLYTIVTGKTNSSTFSVDDWDSLSDADKVAEIEKNSKNTGDQIKYELMSSFIYTTDNAPAETSGASGLNSCDKFLTTTNTTAVGIINRNHGGSRYSAAYDCLLDSDTINRTANGSFGFTGDFTNEYKWGISTICIGFTAYIFIVFCFDVALRCVRLGVLQLIAPIPILSRLDPGSEKSGMFSKWLKDCTSTYLSLFIRLLGVYFAIAIIIQITSNDMYWQGTQSPISFADYPFVKIFIILGLLMFAKQLPQFIENLTGFKMDSGGMNLKKKVGSIPLAGKPMLAGAGLAGRTGKALGLMGGRYAGRMAGFAGRQLGRGIGWADNHLLGGIGHRGVSAVRGFGHNVGGAAGGVWSRVANSRFGQWVGETSMDARNTFATIGTDIEKTTLGAVGYDPMKKLNDRRNQIESAQKQASAILSRANSEMIKYENLQFQDDAGNAVTMKDFKVAKEYLNALRNRDTSRMSDAELLTHTEEINRLQNSVGKTEKNAEQAYVTAIQQGTLDKVDAAGNVVLDALGNAVKVQDSELMSMIGGLKNTASRSSVAEVRAIDTSNGAAIKNAKDTMSVHLADVNKQINDKQALSNPSKKS